MIRPTPDARRCPRCGGRSKVVDQWLSAEGVFARRRECLTDGWRWTTKEQIDAESSGALREERRVDMMGRDREGTA